jgi:excisionase family DNA binding protein
MPNRDKTTMPELSPNVVVKLASKRNAAMRKAAKQKAAPEAVPPLSDRPTLTVNEFCQMIGFSRSSYYKAVARGDIRPRKFGKRTLITTEEMKRFVASLPPG